MTNPEKQAAISRSETTAGRAKLSCKKVDETFLERYRNCQ